MSDLLESIRAAPSTFPSVPLRDASLELLHTLGYQGDRTLELGDESPEAFLSSFHATLNAPKHPIRNQPSPIAGLVVRPTKPDVPKPAISRITR